MMKRFAVILSALLLAAFIGVGGLIFYCNQPSFRIGKYLDLGQKYLLEMNYEEAIIAFEKVITIDPKRLDAYEGMASAYEGMQEYKNAADILRQGIDVSGTDAPSTEQADRLTGWYQILAEEALEQGDEETAEQYYSEILELDPGNTEAHLWIERYRQRQEFSAQSESLSQDLEILLANEKYEEIYSLIESERFQSLMEVMNLIGVSDSMIFDTAHGKIGIYKVNSKYGPYMIYYGGYEDNLRKGNGVWIGSSNGSYYCATGEWDRDKPNGSQAVREWNPELNENVIRREINGNAENGLWNGNVYWGFVKSAGKVGYITLFDSGRWNRIRLNRDGNKWIVSENPYGETKSKQLTVNVEEIDEIRGITGFASGD